MSDMSTYLGIPIGVCNTQSPCPFVVGGSTGAWYVSTIPGGLNSSYDASNLDFTVTANPVAPGTTEDVSKLSAYGVIGPVPTAMQDASKLQGYGVLDSIGAKTPKLQGYGVLDNIAASSSKLQGYGVLNDIGIGASKLNGYAIIFPCPIGLECSSKLESYGVLQNFSVGSSKTVGYAVLSSRVMPAAVRSQIWMGQ
jgi:hypothetical protein